MQPILVEREHQKVLFVLRMHQDLSYELHKFFYCYDARGVGHFQSQAVTNPLEVVG